MIVNPDWLKPKVKPYFHQISLECIEEIAEYIESNDIDGIECLISKLLNLGLISGGI